MCNCASHGISVKAGLLSPSVQMVGGLREAGGPQLPRGGGVLSPGLGSSTATVLCAASWLPQCSPLSSLESLISLGPPLPAEAWPLWLDLVPRLMGTWLAAPD